MEQWDSFCVRVLADKMLQKCCTCAGVVSSNVMEVGVWETKTRGALDQLFLLPTSNLECQDCECRCLCLYCAVYEPRSILILVSSWNFDLRTLGDLQDVKCSYLMFMF